jgi:hypothetical protein
MSMSFTLELKHDGHLHRVLVSSQARGWEILAERDSIILMRTHRDDWHRVERDVRLFQMRVCADDAGGDYDVWEKSAA